jgi:hypothetical protein
VKTCGKQVSENKKILFLFPQIYADKKRRKALIKEH